MDKKVIAAVICVVVAGAALGAYFIATPAPQIEQKQSEITITDLAGRQVTVKVPVERVVLTFSFEEPLAVEGGENPFKKIVGWNRGYWEGRRQSLWEKYTKEFPQIKDIPDVGYLYKGTFNVEKVISLKPDVVITSLWEYERHGDVLEKLERAGIPVICIDYHTETLERHTESTLLLGKIFGKEKRAQEIVDFYKKQLEKVYSYEDKIKGHAKPKVYLEGGYKRWRVYDPKTMQGAIAKKLGAINIVGEGTKEVNPEQVLAANPDVIIITGAYWTGRKYPTAKLGFSISPEEARESLKQILDRPGWSDLNAIKNNRVYCIHHGAPRHIYDFYVDQCFAKWFYPEVFKDLNPDENLKEFYEKFMPVKIGPDDTFSISLKGEVI